VTVLKAVLDKPRPEVYAIPPIGYRKADEAVRRCLVLAAMFVFLFVAAGDTFAWYYICWFDQPVGKGEGKAKGAGKKTHCKKCFWKESEKELQKKDLPATTKCVRLVDLKKVREWYAKNCDCP